MKRQVKKAGTREEVRGTTGENIQEPRKEYKVRLAKDKLWLILWLCPGLTLVEIKVHIDL